MPLRIAMIPWVGGCGHARWPGPSLCARLLHQAQALRPHLETPPPHLPIGAWLISLARPALLLSEDGWEHGSLRNFAGEDSLRRKVA